MLALFASLPCSARIFVVSAGVATAAFGFGYGKGRTDGAAVAESRVMKATIEQMRQRGMINEDVRKLPDAALCRELGGVCD